MAVVGRCPVDSIPHRWQALRRASESVHFGHLPQRTCEERRPLYLLFLLHEENSKIFNRTMGNCGLTAFGRRCVTLWNNLRGPLGSLDEDTFPEW